MSRIARLMVYASVLSLLVSTRAAADPVSITSGFLVSTGPMGVTGVGVLGSGGFSVTGVAVVPPGQINPFNDCNPCAPGAALSVGGTLDNAFMGQAKLGGNTYPLTTTANSPNPLSWELFGHAIAPPASGFALLQVPFTMTGSFSPNNAPGVPLSGHGIASLLFMPQTVSEGQPFAWNVSLASYNFSETAATPEPASLTLIGLGLAAGAVRMRRRRMAP